jgi:FtsP/CotA-like multicopper oxidase with cupredoxin domain
MSSGEAKERLAMRALAFKRTRALLVLIVLSAGLALTSSAASAAAVTINLCAVAGTVTLPATPAPVTVPIWGFADGGTGLTPVCAGATASLPGPQQVVNEGDVVTVNVTNNLPAGHTLSFEVPGINFDAGSGLSDSAAVGGTMTRRFTASAAGTYLYQSGGDGNRQAAMGLYGALLVRPTSAPDTPIPGQAYDPATTAYDVEAVLVLSAIDPAFNGTADPNDFNMYTYRATYWLINGETYPDTNPIPAAAGQRVLLRYLNAGFDNTTMQLLGMHEHVVARDARLLNNPFDANAETIPAGATEDAIATVPAGGAPSSNGFALYNRQLHLTNGDQTGTTPTPATGGGMLTFIQP